MDILDVSVFTEWFSTGDRDLVRVTQIGQSLLFDTQIQVRETTVPTETVMTRLKPDKHLWFVATKGTGHFGWIRRDILKRHPLMFTTVISNLLRALKREEDRRAILGSPKVHTAKTGIRFEPRWIQDILKRTGLRIREEDRPIPTTDTIGTEIDLC